MKILTFGLVLGSAIAARAQTFPPTLAERVGVILKASAYIDPDRLPDSKFNPAARFDLRLFQPANTPYKWDFTLPHNPDYPYTVLTGGYGSPDYKTRKRTTIRATLRQFDTYEEKVTFIDLDLAPLKSVFGPSATPRVLSLPEARSLTTPSGITITLPAQSYDAIPSVMAGNPNALFIRIEVSPNAKRVSLPSSPLFRRHHRPVRLQLGVPMLVYGREEFYYYVDAAPNYGRVALAIPNLKTAMHLDELTFFVRQRVDLQTVPVAVEVPISKPATAKAKAKP